jgi:hypothetical protein
MIIFIQSGIIRVIVIPKVLFIDVNLYFMVSGKYYLFHSKVNSECTEIKNIFILSVG